MDLFRTYLEEAIGAERAVKALEALERDASTSVRLNPFKPIGDIFQGGEAVPWSPFGYYLPTRPNFTLDPLFHAGAYYVQDSSAQFVGHVFRQFLRPLSRPVRVLDLCAAPGGKTTDMASSLRAVYGNSFFLVANEVMRGRASILAENVARWGDPCVCVTSVDPAAFASLKGFFDIIVADVPCSGEGMFRKDEQARSQWSGDNVALCAARQRRIVSDVWEALSGGGVFIYSTCTFNSRENDDNVSWISQSLGAEVLGIEADYEGLIRTGHGVSLVPGFVRGEGQYCAAVRKGGSQEYRLKGKAFPSARFPYSSLLEDGMRFASRGDTIIAFPGEIASDVEAISGLHPIAAGTALGQVKGKDLVPHPDLALSLSLRKTEFAEYEADKELALRFLHRDTITIDAPRGIVLIEYKGLPLGFVKNLGNRCNNLLPQGRRIRMDI